MYLKLARGLTAIMGLVGTTAALFFINPQIRSLIEEYFRVIGMFMGALGGLFVLGMATRRANAHGAIVGLLIGVGLMLFIWKNELANGYLFSAIGIVACITFGYIASLFLPSDRRNLAGLTLFTAAEK